MSQQNTSCKRQRNNDYDYNELNVMSYHVPDKYEKCIFATGEKEIHFNAHVDGETITRLKKLISVIVELKMPAALPCTPIRPVPKVTQPNEEIK